MINDCFGGCIGFLGAVMCLRHLIISLKAGLIAVAGLCCLVSPARAEYRLQGGDVLEISVFGVPELRQRASVQLDGRITFPVIGAFLVEGVELSEVQSKIQSAAASKIFRIRTPDGREFSRMFERDEVAATIVEYRPVFITGDVTRPGEQAFRPHMTVRPALASVGGFSALARANATSFDAANLRSEYITAWLSLAR
jgi:polysaccharide biosynthesis/export protein